MRKRILGAALALGLAVAAAPQSARAQSCSTGALQVCAAVQASTANVGGTWHLYLKVWNLFTNSAYSGSLSHVITFAGIGSSWSGTATLVAALFGANPVSGSQDNSPNNNVVGAAIDAGASSDQGVNNGLVGCTQPLPPGQWATCYPGGPALLLDFTTSSQFLLAGAVAGFHSQAVNGTQCSLWWDTAGNRTDNGSADCGGASVTPEPVTMFLLGSGLMGMGGVNAFRRRKREDEEEEIVA